MSRGTLPRSRSLISSQNQQCRTGVALEMSNSTNFDGAPSSPSQNRGGGSSTTAPIPNLSDEEFSYFKRTWKVHLLLAITQALDQANVVGGQVLFYRRKYITIITREEAVPGLRNQVDCIVAAALREDIRAKISVQFEVGEVVLS